MPYSPRVDDKAPNAEQTVAVIPFLGIVEESPDFKSRILANGQAG